METRTTQLLTVVLTALVTFVAAGSASAEAQTRSRRGGAHIVATPGRLVSGRSVGLYADEQLTLEAPSAGDYVLPVGGVIVGGAALIGGAFTFLLGGLGAALSAGFDNDPSWATVYLAAGGSVAIAGAVILGVSIADLVGLRRRSRGAAREAELASVFVAPTADGFTAGLAGTF